MSVNQQSLDQAVRAAQQAGIPQPVRDDGGQVIYYVDPTGAVVPTAIAQEQIARAGAPKATSGQLTQSGGLVKDAPHVAARAQQQDAAQSNANALANYNRTHPPVWVNGQQMIVESLNPDGTPATFRFLGAKTPGMPDQVVDPQTGQAWNTKTQGPTAFDSLKIGSNWGILAGISGDDRFTMSQGPLDVNTGMTPRDGAYGPPGSGDHSASANTVANGTSGMTIADGVQWMVNLAAKNKPAYDELVRQLKHAGYYGTSPGDMIGGGYSEQAGLGFAKMLKDLSVAQQATGQQTSMDQFLTDRTNAAAKAAGDTYQPVNRQYTDPGALAATAKSAAEAAIGRNLTPAEAAAFEANYRAQQDSYYNSVDASGLAQRQAQAVGEHAAGSAAVAPSPDGAANALLQGDQFNQQRANYGVEQFTQALGQLFGVK